MSVASTRTTAIIFTGDVNSEQSIEATNNVSPGQRDIVTLASGDNTITPPGGGSTPKAVTIVPPSSNAILITLKGVGGDTGIGLHKTEHTTIALDSPTGTFVLNAASAIIGVQLIWS